MQAVRSALKQGLGLLMGLATAGAVPAEPSGDGPWAVGRPLPELRLPTIDGAGTIDLASLRGRKLLLIEFASW